MHRKLVVPLVGFHCLSGEIQQQRGKQELALSLTAPDGVEIPVSVLPSRQSKLDFN